MAFPVLDVLTFSSLLLQKTKDCGSILSGRLAAMFAKVAEHVTASPASLKFTEGFPIGNRPDSATINQYRILFRGTINGWELS